MIATLPTQATQYLAEPPLLPQLDFLKRFTKEEYHRILDSGILDRNKRYELLDGVIIEMHADPLIRTIDPGTAEVPLLMQLDFVKRFTKEEYHALIDAGFGGDEGKEIELLDGVLLEKAVPGPKHIVAVRWLNRRLMPLIPDGWCMDTQGSIDLPESEPQPDAVIYRGSEESFLDRLVQASDLSIVIEVSATTLRTDRGEKRWKYAEAGIPVYWILNVADRCVEVYTDPQPNLSPARYLTHTRFVPGQELPIVLDGKTVATIPASRLLP